MNYIAHKREDGDTQSVREHLLHVAELSGNYAIDEMKDLCYIAGILHDAGKYIGDFQRRINGDSSVHVEHSIVGAKILNERYRADYANKLYKMLARNISDIPYDKVNPKTGRKYQSGVIYCRGDKKGEVYDREAVQAVEIALGHNRVETFLTNYSR